MDCSGDVLTAFLDYLYGTLAVAQDGLVGFGAKALLGRITYPNLEI